MSIQSADSAFAQANKCHADGDYATAAEFFDDAISMGTMRSRKALNSQGC